MTQVSSTLNVIVGKRGPHGMFHLLRLDPVWFLADVLPASSLADLKRAESEAMPVEQFGSRPPIPIT